MNKASGDDGIPVELFQILNDDEAPGPELLAQCHIANVRNQALGLVMCSWGHGSREGQSWAQTPRPVLLLFCRQPQQVEGAITSDPVPQGLGS